MPKDNEKAEVYIGLRGVPDDVHSIIVDEKGRTEKESGKECSNPQAVYQLIRKAAKCKCNGNVSDISAK